MTWVTKDYWRMGNKVLEQMANDLHIPTIERTGAEGGDWGFGREYIIQQLVARDNAITNRVVSFLSLLISVAALVISVISMVATKR